MGLLAAVWCMSLSPELLRDKARLLMIISLVLLFIVLIPGIGTRVGGARRWIRIFSFGFQPSELAKLALIIYLADFTSRKRYIMQDLKQGFIPAFLIISVTGGLILLEPDLGTSVVIGVIGIALLFVSGARMKYLFMLVLSAVPFLAVVILAAPYRIKRITAFLSPWSDPKGSGFQLIQSFIALGSGGFTGVGLGASKQKLFYLPQSHTDFIYSIIGEELGFIGTTFVLFLFAVLILYSLKISLKNNELFMSRVILGICVMFAFEVIVNIGVSTGILPTKGLPLPFISYGGSSLVIHMAAVGLLLNMSRSMEE
jgi:cell division protein FtsW